MPPADSALKVGGWRVLSRGAVLSLRPQGGPQGRGRGDPGLWGASHWSGCGEESCSGGEAPRGGGWSCCSSCGERTGAQPNVGAAQQPSGRDMDRSSHSVPFPSLEVAMGTDPWSQPPTATEESLGGINREWQWPEGRWTLKALLSYAFPSAVLPSALPGDLELSEHGALHSRQLRLRKGAEAWYCQLLGGHRKLTLKRNRHLIVWVSFVACTGLPYLLAHLLCFQAAWWVGCFSAGYSRK